MIEYILLGILSGIFLSATGGGWGPIIVPVLILFGFNPMVAKGVTLTSDVFVTGSSSFLHKRANNVRKNLSCALLLGVLGAILGAGISNFISAKSFRIFIGVFEIILGSMLIGIKPRKLINLEANEGFHLAASIGFLAGFFKGFFGAGWGPMGVSLLILFGVTSKKVIGSSLVARLFISGSAAIYYALSNYVFWDVSLSLIIGGVLGSLIGISIVRNINEEDLRTIIGVVIFLLGVLILLF